MNDGFHVRIVRTGWLFAEHAVQYRRDSWPWWRRWRMVSSWGVLDWALDDAEKVRRNSDLFL